MSPLIQSPARGVGTQAHKCADTFQVRIDARVDALACAFSWVKHSDRTPPLIEHAYRSAPNY